MQKNVAGQKIGCQMVSATDGSAFTSAVTVYVTGDAGTQAAGSVGSGACTHEGNGYHTYAPAQAETNYDLVAFTFIGTGAVPSTVQVFTSYPQTGDSYARLGAPAGASVSADVAAVKAQTATIEADTQDLQVQVGTDGAGLTNMPWNAAWDAQVESEVTDALAAYDPPTNAEMEARTIAAASYATAANLATLAGYVDTEVASILAAVDTEVAAILADTNELQTDWVNGGRLDLILDIIAADTTTDIPALIADVPTVAEFEARTLVAADYVVVGDTLAAVTTVGSVTGAVGSVTGAVGSVTGNVGGSVASVAANGITATSIAADAINAAAVKTDAVTKIQNGLATPTNITAGTITTVTNLTNAPTNGDLTATMKTSVTTAATAATPTAAAVTGAVGSVTAPVTAGTVSDQTGYALSSAGIQAIWDALTSALTTVGSISKLLVDNINATISSRSTYAGGDTSGTTTLLSRIVGTLASGTHSAQSGDAFARLGAPAGASVSVDVAAVKSQTAAIETDTQDLQTQIGTAGAGLTVLASQASVDDLPTNAELATALVAANYATAAALDAVEDTVEAIKYITDTLDVTAITQVPASIAGHLTITAGITFTESVSGLTIPADWVAAIWTMKQNVRDIDLAAVLQLRTTNPAAGTDGLQRLNGAVPVTPLTMASGVLTVSQATGTITIYLADELTTQLAKADDLGWDIKFIDADGDSVGRRGTANVVLTETKATA